MAISAALLAACATQPQATVPTEPVSPPATTAPASPASPQTAVQGAERVTRAEDAAEEDKPSAADEAVAAASEDPPAESAEPPVAPAVSAVVNQPAPATDGSAAAEPAPATATAPPPQPQVQDVSGRISLRATDDDYLDDGGAEDVVIYYIPQAPTAPAPPAEFTIDTENKRLQPDVLAVPVGSTVRFPNNDNILHNIFSVSPVATFDLGLIKRGDAPAYAFTDAGHALIHCNVHHAMHADILVLATPHYTQPDTQGRFTLRNLPRGDGILHLWHPQSSSEVVQALRVPVAGDLTLSLSLDKPRVPRHLNKEGRPYRPLRAGDDQYDGF